MTNEKQQLEVIRKEEKKQKEKRQIERMARIQNNEKNIGQALTYFTISPGPPWHPGDLGTGRSDCYFLFQAALLCQINISAIFLEYGEDVRWVMVKTDSIVLIFDRSSEITVFILRTLQVSICEHTAVHMQHMMTKIKR